MTLILAIASPAYALLVADRRYSPQASRDDNERNKIVTVSGNNGRLAVAFTGLARTGDFDAGDWLVDALYENLTPHGDIGLMIDGLRNSADARFDRLAYPFRDWNLSIVGVGFAFRTAAYIPMFFVITNDRAQPIVPWDHFKDKRFGLALGTNDAIQQSDTLMLAYGSTAGVRDTELVAIQDLARAAKPAVAVKNKAVELIRSASSRAESDGTIGAQVGAAIIPRDPASPIETDYLVAENSTVAYIPSHVTPHSAFKAGRVWSNGPSPVAVPKIGRNMPCPCRSGKKYKHCHGR